MKSRRPILALATTSLAWLGLYRLGLTWGATAEERRAAMPGDEIVPTPAIVSTHATTIDASASAIWPWLVQMGWHRGGWYTPRWVDQLLFPANQPSADRIVPEYQNLEVGDQIPDGPPESGCFFVVERLEPEHALVLHSRSHLPPALAKDERYAIDWTWAFQLTPLGADKTRLLFRFRGTLKPLWLLLAYQLFVVPADFVMSRGMCRGIKQRAERPA
jgi:hypothetical protein